MAAGTFSPSGPAISRYRLPRKAVQLATRMALAAKVRDEQVMVIDDLSLAAPRTKDMAAILKDLDCPKGQKLLVATAESDVNVYKSARNIEGVSVSPVADLNALSMLTSRKMLVTKAALDDLVAAAKKHSRTAEAATEA